jgi:hypothetical protein
MSQWIGATPLDRSFNPPLTLTRLLLAGCLLKNEFWEHTCHHTVKHFARIDTLLGIIPHVHVEYLRRVSLSFSSTGYFSLLGYLASPSDRFGSWSLFSRPPLAILGNISTLDHLSLHFQTGLHYPWNHITAGFGRQQHFSCQRIFVDWFLTTGLPHPRTVPRISLLLHVKDSTRTASDRIFNDEREGCHHDLSKKAAAILLTSPHML